MGRDREMEDVGKGCSKMKYFPHLPFSLRPSLSQPGKALFRHNLTSTLEAAIRSSNAQFDDADILKRIDIKIMEQTEGETGWDNFVLDYHTDLPINTILTKEAMRMYHRLFIFLWKLKRVEYTLSNSWSESMRQLSRFQKLTGKNEWVGRGGGVAINICPFSEKKKMFREIFITATFSATKWSTLSINFNTISSSKWLNRHGLISWLWLSRERDRMHQSMRTIIACSSRRMRFTYDLWLKRVFKENPSR